MANYLLKTGDPEGNRTLSKFVWPIPVFETWGVSTIAQANTEYYSSKLSNIWKKEAGDREQNQRKWL